MVIKEKKGRRGNGKRNMTEEKRFEILLEDIQGKVNILVEGQQILKEYIDKKFEEHEKKMMERFDVIELKIEAI